MTQPARAASIPSLDGSNVLAIRRAIDAVRRRVRLQRGLSAAAYAGVAVLAVSGLRIAHSRFGGAADSWTTAITWFAVAVAVFVVSAAFAARVSRLGAAQLFDRAHALPDLMSSAWAFAELPPERRSRFAVAAMADAAAISGKYSAAVTLPLVWPKVMTAWPLLGVGVLALAQAPAAPPRARTQHAKPLLAEQLLSTGELERQQRLLERDREARSHDVSLLELSRAFEQLLARVERRAIDRAQLLRELAELDMRARDASKPSAERVAELQELGRALSSQTDTHELGQALERHDLAAGRSALDKLAARAAPSAAAHERRALEKLRAALRSGLTRAEQQRQQRMQQARRTLDSLQREREQEQPGSPSAHQAERQRALDEALRRERTQRQRERELDRLERELDDAAAQTPNSADQTQRALESASETVERMQRDQQRDRALERMQESISELQQQLTDGHAQTDSDAPTPRDAPDEAQRVTLERFRAKPHERQAARSADDKPADDTEASGTLLPASPENTQSSAAARELKAQRITQESSPSHEGRPERGRATRSGAADADVSVAGVIGQGATRRSVIYDAAARGFGTLGYEKVHADYAQHAEAELEREPLPAGYRHFVHRYFELIQPEDTHE